MEKVLRSLAAVLVGWIIGIELTRLTGHFMYKLGLFQPWFPYMSNGQFVWAILYRMVFLIFGSYLTARLAPEKPRKHAEVLGVLATIVTMLGTMLNWNRFPPPGPHWYMVVEVLMNIPCAWAGAKLWVEKK